MRRRFLSLCLGPKFRITMTVCSRSLYRAGQTQELITVIQHPMDFQTMLKKVKQKQYKSKREFKDDLDLIWSNCLTYNAAEVRLFIVFAVTLIRTNSFFSLSLSHRIIH